MLPAPESSRERSACALARPGAGRATSPRGRQTAATARAPAPPSRRCFIWPCKALRKRTLGAGLSGGERRADQDWADPVRHAGELQLLAPLLLSHCLFCHLFCHLLCNLLPNFWVDAVDTHLAPQSSNSLTSKLLALVLPLD